MNFDLVAIGDWISNNIWLFLLVAAVAFVFHLFRPNGFAIKWLEAKTRQRELDAKQVDDVRAIANIFAMRFDRPDPLLPFDDVNDRPK